MKTIIKEFILKYLEPKPAFDGISAAELAEMLEKELAASQDEERWQEVHYSGLPFRPDDKPDTIIPKEGWTNQT